MIVVLWFLVLFLFCPLIFQKKHLRTTYTNIPCFFQTGGSQFGLGGFGGSAWGTLRVFNGRIRNWTLKGPKPSIDLSLFRTFAKHWNIATWIPFRLMTMHLDPAVRFSLGGPYSKQPPKATMCKSTTWIVYSSHDLTFLAPCLYDCCSGNGWEMVVFSRLMPDSSSGENLSEVFSRAFIYHFPSSCANHCNLVADDNRGLYHCIGVCKHS